MLVLWLLFAVGAAAAEPDEPPASARAFAELLDDPAFRDWLKGQLAEQPKAALETEVAPPPASLTDAVAGQITGARMRLAQLADAAPRLPGDLARAASTLQDEIGVGGLAETGLLLALYSAIGAGVQYLYLRWTRPLRRQVLDGERKTVAGRVGALGARIALAIGAVLAFAIGALASFGALGPALSARPIGLIGFFAILWMQLAFISSRLLFSPSRPQLRVIPVSDATAHLVHRWINILAVAIVLTWTCLQIGNELGISGVVLDVMIDAAVLVVAALLIVFVWQLQPHIRAWRATAAEIAEAERTWGWDDYLPIAATAIITLITVLYILGAHKFVGTLAILGGLPVAVWTVRLIVDNLLRPAGTEHLPAGPPSVLAALLDRGGAALLVVWAAWALARLWGLDIAALTGGDSLSARLFRAGLQALVVVMVADVFWHVTKTAIDRTMHNAAQPGETDEETQRRARLRTLLPIMRNVLFVLVVAIAGLIALASLGVQIAPLLAGAGVVGVAVGFGAQTLVKDVIAGMFYLLDDAFRVGEYVQSGAYKGTVESFSLRSVKLRHHRGPLFTVPFGELGAIQNMSRDWVIDKISLSVVYDTDLVLVKKIVKQVGKELAADEEFKDKILQPLKLQGVEQFGDYAIVLRLKMMTKPGEQFVIRRRAYARLKDEFEQNGIEFATPTVTVASGPAPAAAAGAAHLALAGDNDPDEG